MIGGLYFLSLKTRNENILKRAMALFAHPWLRYSRDGLWDAPSAAFLVDNLVKVRRTGNVTGGSDGSDILLQISEREPRLQHRGAATDIQPEREIRSADDAVEEIHSGHERWSTSAGSSASKHLRTWNVGFRRHGSQRRFSERRAGTDVWTHTYSV